MEDGGGRARGVTKKILRAGMKINDGMRYIIWIV